MRQLKKGFYDSGVEEELLREMCAACRQHDVEIPIRELAQCFDKAMHKTGRYIKARHAIRTISPIMDWELEEALIFLKCCNLGYEHSEEKFCVNEIIDNYKRA